MTDLPRTPATEERIDEAVAESFPASDAPAWTALRAGFPSTRPIVADHAPDLRAGIRGDLESLARAARERQQSRRALEDVVARAMLDAGRAVIREPVDPAREVRNLETELAGVERPKSSVVVAARYDADDPSGVAMLLAAIRSLMRERLRRTLRFVALAGGGGGEYVGRLRHDGVPVDATMFLSRVDLMRDRPRRPLLFIGTLRSRRAARAARDGFRAASRIGARALTLPRWLPGMASSDDAMFRDQGWPAVLVTDRMPWMARDRQRVAPDVDRMAAAVPGISAALVRLAGGRV